mmetsp:Transcript_52658/g.135924  ORF Transcript_52658/g.135924 Transcript_52658/m.135924 type:complete len:111 (+) Transcript_52658:98-430(+)
MPQRLTGALIAALAVSLSIIPAGEAKGLSWLHLHSSSASAAEQQAAASPQRHASAEDSADARLATFGDDSRDGEDTPVELLARRLGEFADNDDFLGAFVQEHGGAKRHAQ